MDTWIDLSPYNLSLMLLRNKGTHYLVILGAEVPTHLEGLKKINYRTVQKRDDMCIRTVNPLADGSLPRDSMPTLLTYGRLFPKAIEVPYDPATHYRDQVAQQVAPKNAPLEMKPPLRTLGMNKNGNEVLLDAAGQRWAKNDKGGYFAEAESPHTGPGLFLRAVDDASLAMCAEGFVEEAFRDQTLREGDFTKFLATIHDAPASAGDANYEAGRVAVEAASARLLVRKSQKALAKAFNIGAKVHSHLAFLSDGKAAQPNGLTPPIAIVAQGLIGTEATLKGKRVHIRNPGYGHAFGLLPLAAELGFSGVFDAVPARQTLAINGLTASTVGINVACDAQIADFRRTVGKPARTSAGPLTRVDLVDALAMLPARAQDGNTAFVLDAPVDDGERQEFDVFRDHVAQHYSFDGEAHIDGALWRGAEDAPDKIVMAVGWRRPVRDPEALPPIPRRANEWNGLWSWRSDVLKDRPHIGAASRADDDAEVEFNGNVKAKRGEFQVPYVSVSRIGTPRTMVPRNLEGATRQALGRIVAKHGDVDAFVAEEYGYTQGELAEIFSPEQVDAMALAVDAEARGRGFLIADQTGVGKGRLLAACIRRNVIKGRKTLFLTEKQTNLSDIVRDLRHTRTLPLLDYKIINDGVQIIDEDTKSVVKRSTPRPEIDAMLASGEWPVDGTNLILGTYSQFTAEFNADLDARVPQPQDAAAEQARDRAAKARWLSSAVGSDDAMIVDECHNAASGTSNVSRNLTGPLSRAASRVFSSATFAHQATHMAFYASLLPDGITTDELSAMLEKGRETFQEVLSGMLVQDGVMIRREFDLSNLRMDTVTDTARRDRNRSYMDAIAPILSEMMNLSTAVDGRIRDMNVRIDEQRPARRRGQAAADAQRRKGNSLSRMGHGAPLYTIARLFIASLRIDLVAELAIESLRNDEKPIILVENTVETLLAEVEESEDENAETEAPDIRVLFSKVLRQLVTVRDRTSDAKGVRRDLTRSIEEIRAKHDHIAAMIDAIPRLPLSAIDEVKRRIEATGFTCGEITGRSLEVRDGKVVRRTIPNPTVVKNDFNSGHLDAIIINNSGSTGIDLHASARFADTRPRHMIELQAPADIVKATQARGRPNRFDQIHPPRITTVLTGLPVEMRLAAMDNAKMRRLSANTTSNRDTASLIRGIPDLINPIGDVVCSRYAEARPDLMRRLGLKAAEVEEIAELNMVQDARGEEDLRNFVAKRPRKASSGREDVGSVTDSNRTANEILSRLIMLPVSLQEKVCTELTAEFYAAVEEMEAKGETPLRTQELRGIVHPRKLADGKPERKVFEGADMEDPDSVFDKPLYIQEAALEREGTALNGEDLVQLVEMGEMGSGRLQSCVDRLRTGIDEILQTYLPENMPTVQLALEAKVSRVLKHKAAIERLGETLLTLKPGSEITYTIDEQPVRGIVTRIAYPDKGMEHVAGSYGVEFLVPGDERPRAMKLQTLMRDEAFEIGPGLAVDDYMSVLKKFDNATAVRLTNISLLINNDYRAMRLSVEHKLGSLRMFRMKDGTIHRGVVVSKRVGELKVIPVPVQGTDMAMAALEKGYELFADPKGIDRLLTVKLNQEDDVYVRLPPETSRRYGHIYEEPRIRTLINRARPDTKGALSLTMKKPEFREVLDALRSTGTGFCTPHVAREWASAWIDANQRRLEPPREAAGSLAMAGR